MKGERVQRVFGRIIGRRSSALVRNHRLIKHVFGLMVVILITAGCSGAQAEPTATPTSDPPPLTPIPPTSTPVPPTPTTIPPTPTPILPTSTPIPASATPIPPTATTERLNLAEFDTLFKIGQRDESEGEFSREFEGVDEISCTVGVDCFASNFPQYHCLRLCSSGSAEAKLITITLTFDQDYSEVVLRLSRDGDETTEVTIDGQQTFLVSKKMLSSGEFGDFGTHDLQIGPLEEGIHTILLAVADDGIDVGVYTWDALQLYGKTADDG